MKRREFIAGLGGAAAWPLTARAQQPAVPVVGLPGFSTPDGAAISVSAVLRGLSDPAMSKAAVLHSNRAGSRASNVLV
jgi:putative ABC transport system substrate-binding protein